MGFIAALFAYRLCRKKRSDEEPFFGIVFLYIIFIRLAPRVPRGSLISYERQLVFYDSCTFRLLLHLLSSHTKFQVIFEPFSP